MAKKGLASALSQAVSTGKQTLDEGQKAGLSGDLLRNAVRQAASQQMLAPTQNISDYIANLVASQQAAQQQQQTSQPVQTVAPGAAPESNNGFAVTEDEESFTSKDDEKKEKKRSPWHERMDEMLGTNGLGSNLMGLAGSLNPVSFDGEQALGYLGNMADVPSLVKGTANEALSAGLAPLDILAPEWAFNPASKEEIAEGYAQGPAEFNGDFSMPSGETVANMTPEQREELTGLMGEGLGLSAASALQFLPIGKALPRNPISETLGKSGQHGKSSMPSFYNFLGETKNPGISSYIDEIALRSPESEVAKELGDKLPTIGQGTMTTASRAPLSNLNREIEGEVLSGLDPKLASKTEEAIGKIFPNRPSTAEIKLDKTAKPIKKGEKALKKEGKEMVERAEKALAKTTGFKGFKRAIPFALAGGGATAALTSKEANDQINSVSSNAAGSTENKESELSTGPHRQTQMQEYYDWLNDLDNLEAQEFASRYADYIDPEIGYANLLASNDADAWGYLLGLSGNSGINNWRNRYSFSGVDLSGDDALDNLMYYLYGPDAINLSDYMYTNDNIKLANDLDAMRQIGRYLSRGGYGSDFGFDENDMAELAAARWITGNDWGNLNVDDMNDIIEAAGDKSKLALVDEDSDQYRNSQWREKEKTYVNPYLMQNELTPYTGFEDALPDQDITAALMYMYNQDPRHTQKLALV